MSFDIYIGQTAIDEERGTPCVKRLDLSEAPAFPGDELSQYCNGRHPGYTQWDDAVRAMGLYRLFFDRANGLMARHPGIAKLTADHHAQIVAALAAHQKRHPNAKPGFEQSDLDPILARLIWLEWWVRWALNNCSEPAIYNC